MEGLHEWGKFEFKRMKSGLCAGTYLDVDCLKYAQELFIQEQDVREKPA